MMVFMFGGYPACKHPKICGGGIPRHMEIHEYTFIFDLTQLRQQQRKEQVPKTRGSEQLPDVFGGSCVCSFRKFHQIRIDGEHFSLLIGQQQSHGGTVPEVSVISTWHVASFGGRGHACFTGIVLVPEETGP